MQGKHILGTKLINFQFNPKVCTINNLIEIIFHQQTNISFNFTKYYWTY